MTQTYLSSADFLKGIALEVEDVIVPGLGTVKVRGLTAREMAQISSRAGDDEGEMMVLAALHGMVEPAMTEDDLPTLRNAAALRFLPVMQRIMALSGLGDREAVENLAGGGS